jgi:hypothetical protein
MVFTARWAGKVTLSLLGMEMAGWVFPFNMNFLERETGATPVH